LPQHHRILEHFWNTPVNSCPQDHTLGGLEPRLGQRSTRRTTRSSLSLWTISSKSIHLATGGWLPSP
jgi:hypothetical protein